jgi:Biotin-requiring enzyme
LTYVKPAPAFFESRHDRQRRGRPAAIFLSGLRYLNKDRPKWRDGRSRQGRSRFGSVTSRRDIMKTIAIKADEALWQNNMLPEGVVVRWFVADGDLAHAGHRMAEVRIEGALHDIVAPADGRIKIEIGASSVIEPGSLLATLVPAA